LLGGFDKPLVLLGWCLFALSRGAFGWHDAHYSMSCIALFPQNLNPSVDELGEGFAAV